MNSSIYHWPIEFAEVFNDFEGAISMFTENGNKTYHTHREIPDLYCIIKKKEKVIAIESTIGLLKLSTGWLSMPNKNYEYFVKIMRLVTLSGLATLTANRAKGEE